MIIAANLKTNLTREKTDKYINEVENFLNQHGISQEVLVFPALSSLNLHVGKVTVGAQNAYPAQNGAFTGEIGNEQLEEFNIKTILIGHSERRHVIGETQAEVVKKFNFYKELGFKIVYCIGESLQIREAGDKVMMNYLSSQFEGIDLEYENLILAYEPVWAIGTGLTPTLEDIESLHLKLKEQCKAPLLYGGSVKVSNAEEVLALNGVDGVLVGGASLNSDDFCTMVKYAQNIENNK
ncbi:triose-phosphate isomerase [Candidatus Sulfurimonas baltica]|uniref:Triosephosphate isomerase n=1 Tax=Candidatus Sulfurimonas baltica TaxID=2740404 RepID=A0A7S7LVT1_9BACT|nr:triose-phosphate isomerase [Candidatus Sulfurimonas baltica]QOY52442.1 triose-phosphate isomerase [Candidatus Sulfurimonas baltica]